MARIENLHEFKLRTEWFSKDSLHFNDGKFAVNRNLRAKVNEDGSLSNRGNISGDPYGEKYCGNTVVFLLDEETEDRLAEIQDRLYANCESIFAERLDKSTFHMTLHDLKSGVPSPELFAQVEKSEKLVKPLIGQIKSAGVVRIKMVASYLFNMGNTSVVLGLAPADEENCRKLMTLYELIQDIESVHLPYQLTPHITMAYYKPLTFEKDQLDGLQQVIRDVNREIRMLRPMEIELTTERLVYQTFTDMNHYCTVE